MGKFDNVPEDVLREYIESSEQQPGESDVAWAQRNQLAELKLLAQYPENTEAEAR